MKNVSKNHIKNTVIKLDIPSHAILGDSGGLVQQPLMMSLISLHGKPETMYHFGYHKGDDFFAYHSQHIKVVETISEIMGSKNIGFNFPLKFSHKWEIISGIQSNGLEDHVWFCEYPENSINGYSACGECVPCKTHKEHTHLLKMNRLSSGSTVYLRYPQKHFESPSENLDQCSSEDVCIKITEESP